MTNEQLAAYCRLAAKIWGLTCLRAGWDGYRGTPVSPACAQFATDMIRHLLAGGLPAPQPVPLPDGTLRLEWHMNEYDLDITVTGPDEFVACRTDLSTGGTEETGDLAEMLRWISGLGASAALAALKGGAE